MRYGLVVGALKKSDGHRTDRHDEKVQFMSWCDTNCHSGVQSFVDRVSPALGLWCNPTELQTDSRGKLHWLQDSNLLLPQKQGTIQQASTNATKLRTRVKASSRRRATVARNAEYCSTTESQISLFALLRQGLLTLTPFRVFELGPLCDDSENADSRNRLQQLAGTELTSPARGVLQPCL